MWQRVESEEDDDQCALSDRWKYQRHSRRWSRLDSTDLLLSQSDVVFDHAPTPAAGTPPLDGSLRSTASWDSAIEASLICSNSSTLAGGLRCNARFPPPPLAAADVLPSMTSCQLAAGASSDPASCDSDRSSLGGDAASPGPQRSATGDRLRGACRSVLRKVENKIRRRAGGGPPSPTFAVAEIGSPTVVDEVAMRARMDALRCVDLVCGGPAAAPAGTGRGHSAPSTPTAERSSLDATSSADASLQQRRRQRSLDSSVRVSVYDNVVTDDDPQRQLDVILTALYRDIGMLSTSLAVVNEEHNGNTPYHIPY